MDIFKDRWYEIKNKIRQKWNKLTNEDIDQINGQRAQLIHKLRSKYDWEQKQAEEEVKRFEGSLQGEKGQKTSAEYNRDEESEKRSQQFNREERSETERDEDSEGYGKKTKKFDKEYFE